MSTDWQLNTIHSGTFLRLQRLLPKLRGFRVLFAQHNNPTYRDGIIDALSTQKNGANRILDAREYESYPLLEQQLLSGSESEDTHIISLESLTSEEQERTFKGLNYHREQLAENCQNTLIFWLPESLINSLVQGAADFWAWREQVFDFLLPIEKQPHWQADSSKIISFDNDIKQRRIQEINDYLTSQNSKAFSLTIAEMQHELGNLYKAVGEYSLAQAAMNNALNVFDEMNEQHAYADVMMDQAELRFMQGDSDDALQILENRVVPLVTKLGDIKQQAEALNRIADILQDKGQLSKALNIRRNNEVPLYEQLGDVSSKAVAMGKIAVILVSQCNLNGALKVRRNEEIPLYERLGDMRSKALAMGKVAYILQLQGLHREALQIRRNSVIPLYEKLGDIRGLLVARFNLGMHLWSMDAGQSSSETKEILSAVLTEARDLKIPEAEHFEKILELSGLPELIA